MTTTTAREMSAASRLEAAGFRGTLVAPGHPAYDEARAVHNASIDRRPRLIARCVDPADVIAAVRCAREAGLTIAVRGGGHDAAGRGVGDDALVVDLSGMRGVHVDPAERRIRVEGGAVWGDVDHATYPFGLAVPGGCVSTTGVGGLTLGGGVGHLTRQFGLTIDSLLAVDVVLPDGAFVTADADRHPDLFWAVRGGGGNVGVVTCFTFRGHPVRDVVGGPMLFDLDQGPAVMRAWDAFLDEASEAVTGWFGCHTVPPATPFPEELRGRLMCVIVWCVNGSPELADQLLAPVRALGPAFDGVGPVPFPRLQSTFDTHHPAGLHRVRRAGFVDRLTVDAIDVHLEHARLLPTPHSMVHLYPMGGAAGRVGRSQTAFSHRQARYAQVIEGADPDPGNLGALRSWARAYHDALHPHAAAGHVDAVVDEEGNFRVREYDARLAVVRRRYDPDKVFQVNREMAPEASGATVPASIADAAW